VNVFAKSLCPILTAAEGFILGVGAKMFTIAGPVIVYGVSASVVYGLIYWLWSMI
jgi:stage V sporulation protein AC